MLPPKAVPTLAPVGLVRGDEGLDHRDVARTGGDGHLGLSNRGTEGEGCDERRRGDFRTKVMHSETGISNGHGSLRKGCWS